MTGFEDAVALFNETPEEFRAGLRRESLRASRARASFERNDRVEYLDEHCDCGGIQVRDEDEIRCLDCS